MYAKSHTEIILITDSQIEEYIMTTQESLMSEYKDTEFSHISFTVSSYPSQTDTCKDAFSSILEFAFILCVTGCACGLFPLHQEL